MNLKDFVSSIDTKFRRHIHGKTYVPISPIGDKKTFLISLYKDIINHNYFPAKPREYIVSNKHNMVSRIVPIFELKDSCTYYYCIKKIEKEIAINRVEGTYGGFSLGGCIRRTENEEFKRKEEIFLSSSPFSYNLLAWVNAWRDFQKKIKIYSESGAYCYFIQFDIANFYDCINLHLLEKKVRSVTSNDKRKFTDLLFFFLRNQSKNFVGYNEKSVGLPQDETGDCSRILANFFLQDYDQIMKNLSDKLDVKYFRYADDQLLFAKNAHTAEKMLFEASKELHKIGLNINSSKVKIFQNKNEFDQYRAFEIFDLLGDKNNTGNIERAIDVFLNWQSKGIDFRGESVLNRFLSCDLSKIDLSKKMKLLSIYFEEKYLSIASVFILTSLYKILPNDKTRKEFLAKLMCLAETVLFNSFHYNLLILHNEIKDAIIDEKRIREIIESVKFK